MSARHWSFATLLMAAAGANAAEPPAVQQQAAQEAPQPAAKAHGTWSYEVVGKQLIVKLAVTNDDAESMNVLVARGSRPGAYVKAAVGGADLQVSVDDSPEARKEMMSRRGPMPRYAVLAANASSEEMIYKFDLPEGYAGQAIDVTAEVYHRGGQLTLTQTLTAAKGA